MCRESVIGGVSFWHPINLGLFRSMDQEHGWLSNLLSHTVLQYTRFIQKYEHRTLPLTTHIEACSVHLAGDGICWAKPKFARSARALLGRLFVSCLLTRFLLQAFMFQKLAIWLLSRGDQSIGLQDVTEVAITKCVESMWRLTYYVAVQMFIMLIMYEEPWFGNRKAFFEGWPDQTIKFTVKIFYVCECGFYIFSIAALILWKVRRKYFSIMMLNHIITLVLIVYSYATRFQTFLGLGFISQILIIRFFRIGSIVLALHDTSDVFLEIANLFKYGGKELAANMSFGLFALSWLFLRLIYYPFCIIWSTSYELIEYIDLQIPYHTWIYYIFNTLLLTLLLLHLYWWFFICSMVVKPLECKGKVDENAASDSERSR